MTLWENIFKFVLQIADSESFISRFDRLTDVIPWPDTITQRVHLSWYEINILHMKKNKSMHVLWWCLLTCPGMGPQRVIQYLLDCGCHLQTRVQSYPNPEFDSSVLVRKSEVGHVFLTSLFVYCYLVLSWHSCQPIKLPWQRALSAFLTGFVAYYATLNHAAQRGTKQVKCQHISSVSFLTTFLRFICQLSSFMNY